MHPTKQKLLAAGLPMLLEQGYNDLGIQALLESTSTPKGSFYHHFRDKEDFALQVIDLYMDEVHSALDHCLGDETRVPLDRIRFFFESVQKKYRSEGYLGCLLGGLGQELSGVSVVFSKKIDGCLSYIAARIAQCLVLAKARGELAADAEPRKMASLLVDCWEGAALRSRLRGSSTPLKEMLDFYFRAATSAPSVRTKRTRASRVIRA